MYCVSKPPADNETFKKSKFNVAPFLFELPIVKSAWLFGVICK